MKGKSKAHVCQKYKNIKKNRDVHELIIITKKITKFNAISVPIMTMFDKCDLYSIGLSKAS